MLLQNRHIRALEIIIIIIIISSFVLLLLPRHDPLCLTARLLSRMYLSFVFSVLPSLQTSTAALARSRHLVRGRASFTLPMKIELPLSSLVSSDFCQARRTSRLAVSQRRARLCLTPSGGIGRNGTHGPRSPRRGGDEEGEGGNFVFLINIGMILHKLIASRRNHNKGRRKQKFRLNVQVHNSS